MAETLEAWLATKLGELGIDEESLVSELSRPIGHVFTTDDLFNLLFEIITNERNDLQSAFAGLERALGHYLLLTYLEFVITETDSLLTEFGFEEALSILREHGLIDEFNTKRILRQHQEIMAHVLEL